VDGHLKTGRDVVIGGLLGADEFGFATSALVSLGCILMRKCHLNTCSVGVATQDPELRRKFSGKPEHVVNFFRFVAREAREIMAEMGIRKFDDLIGRSELLEVGEAVAHWKSKGLDYSKILYKPAVPPTVAIRNVTGQNHDEIARVLDHKLIADCRPAVENRETVNLRYRISNTDRTTGAMLSYHISKKHGEKGLPDHTINIYFKGSAGQSFGAFLAPGVAFKLEGDANDYLGKGLSGGTIYAFPPKESTFIPEENQIVGNVVLYGAISGRVFLRGRAGERFAIRNSGCQAVVEGVGDHGCEYMTGGTVVVLGDTGRNFAAGMSGGIAYVWDRARKFKVNCNLGMVDLLPLEEDEDMEALKKLLEEHCFFTQSPVARKILDDWETHRAQFVKVYPRDYRKVVEARKGKNAPVLEEVA
jgi:glutamate synthase domain-containing protein 3